MRTFVLLAITAATVACNASAFACASDGDCMLGGEPGICDLDCADCMRCVDAEGEPCADVGAACFALVGCGEAAGCLEACVAFGECGIDCCAGLDSETAATAVELHECRATVCDAVCEDIDATCN